MRKIIVMLMAVGCFAAFTGNAQTTTQEAPSTSPNPSSTTRSQDDLIKVRISELPAMVTQTLGNSEYTGWTISSAYRTKDHDQYLVEVKKGKETKSYWFDKNGNRLEGKVMQGSGSESDDDRSDGSGTGDK